MKQNIPKTKSMYAYESIKDAILQGEYGPDERLILKDLWESLSLSVIPVRESLSNLERDGLVTLIPHQGYTVAPLSINEFDELLAIRLSLEITALPHSIKNITEKQMFHITSLTEKMYWYWEKHKDSPATINIQKAFMTMNKELHIGIASASQLIYLPEMLLKVFDLSQHYMNIMEYVVGIREIDVREHVEMVRLIKERKEEELKTLLTTHYERVIEEFRKTSENFPSNALSAR
jgi:DNA-binding GntR family transcriptional regulator